MPDGTRTFWPGLTWAGLSAAGGIVERDRDGLAQVLVDVAGTGAAVDLDRVTGIEREHVGTGQIVVGGGRRSTELPMKLRTTEMPIDAPTPPPPRPMPRLTEAAMTWAEIWDVSRASRPTPAALLRLLALT